MILESTFKQVIFNQQNANIILLRDISKTIQVEAAKVIENIAQLMIANTSHDMRTPIGTILTLSDQLDAVLKEDKDKKVLKIIKISANMLKSLVNDTLDFYQIKSG